MPKRSKDTRWLGLKPWIIITAAVVIVLIILFIPMFSAVKVIQVTETVIITVQKQVPYTTTEDVVKKVYVGYLQEQGQTYSINVPGTIIIGSTPNNLLGTSADRGSGSSSINVPNYGYNYTVSGRRYQIDVSDQIVDFQQANGPDGSLTITLTDADQKQTVYRYIDTFDLTKTGEIKVPTTVTKMNTVSEQQPQQITKEQAIPIQVNLIQLLSTNLREQ